MIAAVRSGADAVYVGAKQFSARAGAHNFDDDELKECVRYCHVRGVKVYLALNTLIFDNELENALELARSAAKADIDAIIIQDIGLDSLIREAIPELPLHASTQMSVHTPRGAKALWELGYKRVVVSRELSLDEIRAIREYCPEVELEVFVHGALCMCVSGQCYFSAMLGGRSANRGMCAQPCRLPMQFGENDHALSLKDNGSLDFLRELEAIGVASAKIEGRMKRPEYVAAATAAAFEAREYGKVGDSTAERLRSVFSRSGFTDGYLRGETGAEMFGFRRKDDVVTADSRLLKSIRNEYKDEAQRVPLAMKLTVRVGEMPRLEISDGQHHTFVEGDAPAEKAERVALDAARAEQNLKKTGGTPFYIEHFAAEIAPDAAMSAAALNALRRQAIEAISELRAVRRHNEIKEINIDNFVSENENTALDWFCAQDRELPGELRDAGLVFIALDGMQDGERIRHMIDDGWRLGVEAPRVMFGNENAVFDELKRLKALGVGDLLAHNIAAVSMGKELGFTVHAGFGMNLANSVSLNWAKQYGIADAEISVELSQKQIEALKKAIPVGVIRYGYFPLMISRNAPAGKKEACKNMPFLQDRKNERFRVLPRDGYTEILNCVPVFLPEKDYKESEQVFHIIRFTVENYVDNKENILEKIRENRGFERFTHGLYTRGVKNFTIF